MQRAQSAPQCLNSRNHLGVLPVTPVMKIAERHDLNQVKKGRRFVTSDLVQLPIEVSSHRRKPLRAAAADSHCRCLDTDNQEGRKFV